MKEVEKANLDAMRTLQKIKEQANIPEDVIEDIKKTHQEFIKKREKVNLHDEIQTPIEEYKRNYGAKSSTSNTFKRNKGKRILAIGGISIIVLFLFLTGIRYGMSPSHSTPTYYDTISMGRFYLNKDIKNKISFHYLLIYPTQIGDYDLTDFYNELLVRYFYGEEKRNKNIDFEEIIQELLPEHEYIDEVFENQSTEVICNYYKDRKWLSVDATIATCDTRHCVHESTFFYNLEKQKVLEFDDIFLPEKQDKLRKFIKERCAYELRYSNSGLSYKDFEIDIINYHLVKKDSIWCWSFDCMDKGRELAYVYYPINVTIAEKGLTEYLSYTLPDKW